MGHGVRPQRGHGRSRYVRLFAAVLPQPPAVQAEPLLCGRRVLCGALRAGSHAQGMGDEHEAALGRAVHQPEGHLRRQRADEPRDSVRVLPGDGDLIQRPCSRSVECDVRDHEGRGAAVPGGHPRLRQGHPRDVHPRHGCVQSRPHRAILAHGAQPLRHAREVQSASVVLRLLERWRVPVATGRAAGAGRRRRAQVEGLQPRRRDRV